MDTDLLTYNAVEMGLKPATTNESLLLFEATRVHVSRSEMKPFATAVLVLGLLGAALSKRMMGAYFPNWARHRSKPYTYVPSDLVPIVGSLDRLMYAFVHFDQNYELYSVDEKDAQFIPQIVALKKGNRHLEVLVSVGGRDFPSANFSDMVSSYGNRQAFVYSVRSFLDKHGLDGVDIYWDYPCRPPRDYYVKTNCSDVKQRHDSGGKCPNDADNLLALTKELRHALGRGKIISLASPASESQWSTWRLRELSDYVDAFHLTSYDYTVSDLTASNITAPNSPLYTPERGTGVVQQSLNHTGQQIVAPELFGGFFNFPKFSTNLSNTVTGYLKAGVPPGKMMVGIPLYGHTW